MDSSVGRLDRYRLAGVRLAVRYTAYRIQTSKLTLLLKSLLNILIHDPHNDIYISYKIHLVAVYPVWMFCRLYPHLFHLANYYTLYILLKITTAHNIRNTLKFYGICMQYCSMLICFCSISNIGVFRWCYAL